MPRIFSTKIILCFLALLLLDWIFLPPLKNGFFQPILLYLIVLYAGFEYSWRHALRFAFAVGFLRDALSTQPLGVETAVLFSATLALAFFVKKVERNSFTMRLFVGFFYIFSVNFFVLVLSSLLGFVGHSLWKCFTLAVSTGFSTVLFLPLFSTLMEKGLGEKMPRTQYELFR